MKGLADSTWPPTLQQLLLHYVVCFLLMVMCAMFSLDVLSYIEPLWDVWLFVADLDF